MLTVADSFYENVNRMQNHVDLVRLVTEWDAWLILTDVDVVELHVLRS